MKKRSLRSNIVFNLVGASLPLGTSLIVIPIYLGRIGPSRFGIISLVWLLFGYFGLFDLGLSQATTNLLARRENQAADSQREIFWTAAMINGILGVAGAVAFAVAGGFILETFFGIPRELKQELTRSIPWVACLIPLATTGSVFAGALEAHERFLSLNVIQVCGAVLGQLLPLFAVIIFSARIEVAVEATIVARVVTTIPMFVIAIRECRVRMKPIVSRSSARALFGYGGWVTVSNIVGPILVSIDQFMIGAIVGVAYVPRYSIPFNIATKLSLIPSAMTRALFPQLTREISGNAKQRAQAIAGTVARTMALICAPLMILCSRALSAWLGVAFSADASILTRIIVLGVWINGVACVAYVLIHSQRRPSVTAMIHVAELLPFFLVLWLGLHFFGLVGASVAWSLRVLADAILLCVSAGFSVALVRDLLPSAALMSFSFLGSLMNHGGLAWTLAFAATVFCIGLTYAVLADPLFGRLYMNARSWVRNEHGI